MSYSASALYPWLNDDRNRWLSSSSAPLTTSAKRVGSGEFSWAARCAMGPNIFWRKSGTSSGVKRARGDVSGMWGNAFDRSSLRDSTQTAAHVSYSAETYVTMTGLGATYCR